MKLTSQRLRYLLALSALSVASCTKVVPSAGPGPTASGPGQYVNPLIGTAAFTDPKLVGYVAPPDWHGVWAGLAFPGSALPNTKTR
jgi:hypothetical protein